MYIYHTNPAYISKILSTPLSRSSVRIMAVKPSVK